MDYREAYIHLYSVHATVMELLGKGEVVQAWELLYREQKAMDETYAEIGDRDVEVAN